MAEDEDGVEPVGCNALFCCGRHWCISSPDFAAPGLCLGIIHLGLFLGVGSLLVLDKANCGTGPLTSYLYGALLLQAVAFAVSCAIFISSAFCTRWGVNNTGLATLIQARFVLLLVEIGWGGYGIYALTRDNEGQGKCGATPAIDGALVLIVVSLTFAVMQLCCTGCTYNSQGRDCAHVDVLGVRKICSEILCFRLWKSWTIEDLDGEIIDSAIADVQGIFGGFDGLTGSDVVRALKLVRDDQRLRVQKGHRFEIPDLDDEKDKKESKNRDTSQPDDIAEINAGERALIHGPVDIMDHPPDKRLCENDGRKKNEFKAERKQSHGLSPAAQKVLKSLDAFEQPSLSPNDTAVLREISYYFKFATAACGWPIYMLHRGLLSSCYAFGCPFSCLQNTTPEQEEHINYRACGWRASLPAFVHYANIKIENIFIANLAVDIDQVVYYVCLDDRTNTLVVAVRGTMSAQDMFTDARQKYVEFPLANELAESVMESEGKGSKPVGICAEGFRNVCRKIIESMKNCTGVINALKNPNVDIVVTGHSLGAAIASLLTIFMLNEDIFKGKRIRGFPFAPPPTVNKTLANCKRMKNLNYSLVYQNDLVPRLSVYNLKKLKKQISKELQRAEGKSVRTLMSKGLSNGDIATEVSDDLLIKIDPRNSNPLHISGTIFHMKTKLVSCSGVCTGCYQFICCCCRGCVAPVGTYSTIVYKAKSDAFQEIIVDTQMTHEHLPSSYERALQDLHLL